MPDDTSIGVVPTPEGDGAAASAEPQASQDTGVISDAAGQRVVPLEAHIKLREDLTAAKNAAREEADRAKQEAEFLRNIAMQNQQQIQAPQTPQQPQLRDDDVMMYGDFKKVYQSDIESERAKFQQATLSLQERMIRASTPDFDEVIGYAKELVQKAPYMDQVFMATPDPWQAAYDYGKTHPKYIEKLKTKDVTQTIDNINRNLNQPATLTGVGAVNVQSLNDVQRIEGMDSKSFREKIELVKRGRLRFDQI